MPLLFFLLAVAAGVANPFQSGVNAELNKQLTRPVWTGIIVYASGLLGLILVQLVTRQQVPVGKLAGVPWWAWMGGLISIISTMVGLTLTQKLGSGLFTGLSLTAAVLTSVALDHFGLAGLRQHTASPGRLAGCALLIAGIWLVAKF